MESEQHRLIEMLPESVCVWIGDNLLLTFVLGLGVGFILFVLLIRLLNKFSGKSNSSDPLNFDAMAYSDDGSDSSD